MVRCIEKGEERFSNWKLREGMGRGPEAKKGKRGETAFFSI